MASGDRLSVVLGAGPVGRALVSRLLDRGDAVRVATRSGQADVGEGVEIVGADIADADQATSACAGADTLFSCVGLGYANWPELWPPMMEGMLAAAAAAEARFVFMDNLYMYGPVDVPMTEDLPLTSYGRKPATRAAITRMWQEAHEAGHVQAAAVRASDFYGPEVTMAALGATSFGRISQGKAAQVVGDVDQPHSFTYAPDVARALVTISEAGDSAMGQAWHVPNAADRTVRELLTTFANEAGKPAKVQKMPGFMMTVLALANSDVRELKEMLYQWQAPFQCDHSKFGSQFWNDPTPFEEGIPVTADWYERQ